MKLFPDRRERNVHDRVVEPDDEQAHAADQQDSDAAPPRSNELAAGAGRPRQAASRSGVFGHLAILAVLVAGALAMFARVFVTGHPTSTVLCQCGDPGQTVWFMAWVPYALAHLHNPLFTTRMLAGQGGANLLESTSYLLPSFVLSPVTVLFGANASSNVADALGPVLTGWATYWAAGRLSRRWLPRAMAALVAGFSPMLVGSAIYGHLNFDWLYFPPLLFLACHEILAGSRLRAATAGALLGLLVVAQFFTGTEPLLITALAAVPSLAVAFVAGARSADLARVRRVAVAFGTALGLAGVLLAYPVWFVTDGPRRVVGVPWPGTTLFGNSPSSIVEPGRGVHAGSYFAQVGGYFGPVGPNTSFLGLGLLVLLAVCLPVLVWRRRLAMWPLVAGGCFAWICSLGVYLMPGFHTPRWLLWRYLSTWPYVDKIAPGRFALVVAAAAGLLLALGMDTWAEMIESAVRRGGRRLQRAHARSNSTGTRVGAVAVSSVLLAAGFAAATVPAASELSFPLVMHSDGVPRWFTTTARHLGPSTEVLTYPYASSGTPDAMYWQAADGLGFALAGGRALVPGGDGRHSEHVSPIRGSAGLLTRYSYGSTPPPVPSVAQVKALRRSLQRWGVDLVVVVDHGRAPAWAVASFAEALGRLPMSEQHAEVWSVRAKAPAVRILPPAAFARCASQASSVAGLKSARRCLATYFGGSAGPHHA